MHLHGEQLSVRAEIDRLPTAAARNSEDHATAGNVPDSSRAPAITDRSSEPGAVGIEHQGALRLGRAGERHKKGAGRRIPDAYPALTTTEAVASGGGSGAVRAECDADYPSVALPFDRRGGILEHDLRLPRVGIDDGDVPPGPGQGQARPIRVEHSRQGLEGRPLAATLVEVPDSHRLTVAARSQPRSC